MDNKPTIPLYVGLFAGSYLLLSFIIGYAITWLRMESSARVNDFIIFLAAAITTFWFTRKEKRHFTKSELTETIIGSVAAGITIEVCLPLIILRNIDFSNKWLGLFLILGGHSLLTVLSYLISKKIPLPANAA
jgi:hypothetical protein